MLRGLSFLLVGYDWSASLIASLVTPLVVTGRAFRVVPGNLPSLSLSASPRRGSTGKSPADEYG